MTDYISREAFKEEVRRLSTHYLNEWSTLGVLAAIDRIPAADVAEVVRCKDCIYAYPYGLEIKCTKHSGRSEKFGEDASYSQFHDLNWFCADAQGRRTNERN